MVFNPIQDTTIIKHGSRWVTKGNETFSPCFSDKNRLFLVLACCLRRDFDQIISICSFKIFFFYILCGLYFGKPWRLAKCHRREWKYPHYVYSSLRFIILLVAKIHKSYDFRYFISLCGRQPGQWHSSLTTDGFLINEYRIQQNTGSFTFLCVKNSKKN